MSQPPRRPCPTSRPPRRSTTRCTSVACCPPNTYLDSGYPSADTITTARTTYGITLVTPALLDWSAQARAGTGLDKSAFAIDFDTRQVTCPQGNTSTSWSPASQRGTEVIVVKF